MNFIFECHFDVPPQSCNYAIYPVDGNKHPRIESVSVVLALRHFSQGHRYDCVSRSTIKIRLAFLLEKLANPKCTIVKRKKSCLNSEIFFESM